MPTFKLSGDLLKAVFVEVEADTLEAAIDKAENGHFKIVDDDGNGEFTFDGTAFDENDNEIESVNG